MLYLYIVLSLCFQVHLVHFNTDLYSSFAEAASAQHGLCVLGAFIQVRLPHMRIKHIFTPDYLTRAKQPDGRSWKGGPGCRVSCLVWHLACGVSRLAELSGFVHRSYWSHSCAYASWLRTQMVIPLTGNNFIIKNFIVRQNQRFCEPARLRIGYCSSIHVCLVWHLLLAGIRFSCKDSVTMQYVFCQRFCDHLASSIVFSLVYRVR